MPKSKPVVVLSVALAAPALVGLVNLAGLATTTHAQDVSKLASELSDLRGEVEVISSDLSEDKTDLQDQLRTYARQKSELTLELDRERIRLQKLRLAVAQKQKEVEAQNRRFKDLLPIFEGTASSLRSYIEGTLPFRKEERLSELGKLEESLKGGLVSPPKAMVRLWGMVEDELQMTRDSGMFRQTIMVAGREQLADVVRVGMVMLFYRTADGQVGYAFRQGDVFSYRELESEDDVALVETMFDSFKKQVRVGLFELPNPAATEEL